MNPSIDRQRAGLWVGAAAAFAALAFVVWQYLGTLMLGLFVYYITRPVYRRVRRRVPTRTLAALTSLLTVAMPVLLLFAWALVVGLRELFRFLQSDAFAEYRELLAPYVDASGIVAELRATVRRLVEDPAALPGMQLGEAFGSVLDTVLASLGILAAVGLNLFVALVVAFYLLRDDYKLVGWAHETFVAEGGVLDVYFHAVDRDLKNVYFGNILNALATGVLGAVTYNLVDLVAPEGVGIPNPTLLGLLAGAGSLIPVVGMKLVWIPAVVIVLADSLMTAPRTVWFPVLFALVSVVVVDYIPDQLLRPYVSGRTLHVGAVMLAYILGTLLFGWYGLFFGPLVLVVVWEFGRVVVPWLVEPDDWRPPEGFVAAPPAVEAGGAGETLGPAGEDAAVERDGGGTARSGGDGTGEPAGSESAEPPGDGRAESGGRGPPEPEDAPERDGEGASGDSGREGPADPDDDAPADGDGRPTGGG